MRLNILLFASALIGILLATSGILDQESQLNTGDSLAQVNGIDIPKQRLQAIAKSINENRTEPLNSSEYALLLDELIEEELMVQRGQELGLLQLNSSLRNFMIQAVNTSLISENLGKEVSDEELEAFYSDNKDFFSKAAMIHFSYMKFSDEQKALQASERLLQGEEFDQIKKDHAEPEIIKAPQGLLHINTIRQYFGPELSETLANLETNTLSHPVLRVNSQAKNWFLLLVHQKKMAAPADFSEIKQAVLTEYQRQRNEQTIREYKNWLYKRADIDSLDEQAIMQKLAE